MCYCKTVVIFQVSVSIKDLMNSHNVEFFSMSILVFCLSGPNAHRGHFYVQVYL